MVFYSEFDEIIKSANNVTPNRFLIIQVILKSMGIKKYAKERGRF